MAGTKPPGKPPGQQGNKEIDKPQIKGRIKSLVAEEIEKRKIERHLVREDVREALGVGDMDSFVEQMESNYTKMTAPTATGGVASGTGFGKLPKPKVKRVNERKKKDLKTLL